MDITILLRIIFLGVGGIITGTFFIAGLYYLNRKRNEMKCTSKTYGKIINNIRHKVRFGTDEMHDHRIYWYSLCEYTIGETKCVRQTNIGTFQPRKIGEIVTVHYNPNNYHDSYIEGDNNSGIKALVCLFLGIISMIFIYFIIKII